MLETREGGCHCGRVRFRARVDLDLLSQCSCSICTKKGILHLPIAPDEFELLRGKDALTAYRGDRAARAREPAGGVRMRMPQLSLSPPAGRGPG
jgi:hypothetical protein